MFDPTGNNSQSESSELTLNYARLGACMTCACICLYECMSVFFLCIIRGHSSISSIGGAIRARSIVVVPCPLPGDIHHRGAPRFLPTSTWSSPGESFNEDQIIPTSLGLMVITSSTVQGLNHTHLHPQSTTTRRWTKKMKSALNDFGMRVKHEPKAQ